MNGPSDSGPIDAELLGRLLDELGPALALYAAGWTNAADDCVQEALVELARQPTVPENVRAWLYRVVKHKALNVARSSRRRRERERRAALGATGSASADLHGRLTEPAAPAAFDQLDTLAIAEALERLDPNEREIIVMRIWGGSTLTEIAAVLSVSTSTIHRQYQRALERLRQILEMPCPTKDQAKNPSSRTN